MNAWRHVHLPVYRGGVGSRRDLGLIMNVRGQIRGNSIGMLAQTLIMSRLDQLS
jgi:hypothetical protein